MTECIVCYSEDTLDQTDDMLCCRICGAVFRIVPEKKVKPVFHIGSGYFSIEPGGSA